MVIVTEIELGRTARLTQSQESGTRLPGSVNTPFDIPNVLPIVPIDEWVRRCEARMSGGDSCEGKGGIGRSLTCR
jgi:hypothetical protein